MKSSPKILFKKIMKKIKMTLDGLAKEMRKGFASIEKRFVGVDKRFDKMEIKIDEKVDSLARAVKVGFDEVDERFDQNDRQHNIINVRLDNLERGQDKIAERLGVMKRKGA